MYKIHAKHKVFLFNLCFFSAAISLSLSLITDWYPDKIFYFLSYAAIALSVLSIIRDGLLKNIYLLTACGSFFLVGFIRVIWAVRFNNSEYMDVIHNYFVSGKRFFLTGFILYFFYVYKEKVRENIILVSSFFLLIGMLITVHNGHQEWIIHHTRIKLLADAATTVSYLISVVFITTLIISISVIKNTFISLFLFLCIFLSNIYLLLLSESRAALIVSPLTYLLFFLFEFKKIKIKNKVPILVVLPLIIMLITPGSVIERFRDIKSDILSYHINNSTSIGARFSIWKSGLYSTGNFKLWQSPDSRNQKAREYIKEHERANSEADKNIIYHLHNDLLEIFSLQGMAGLLSVILLYLSLIIFSIRQKIKKLLYILIPSALFGLTDTVLIQRHTVLILCLCIVLIVSLPGKNSDSHSGISTT